MEDRDLTQRGLENQGEGKLDKLKGKVKDAIGGLTGDSSTQAEGKWDQAKGSVKDALGEGQQRLDRNL
jgi:uncharacterized protein YjbJ (UPF0337 family)